MGDYLRTLPGVNFLDQGVGRNTVAIRGLVVDTEFPGGSGGNTTGVYFGEIPLTGFSAFEGSTDIKMIDLERVEVLRGPQGTLFGSGSLAGAIRNIPSSPRLDALEGRVEVGSSNTAEEGNGNSRVEGILNIPLIEEKLAVRAVVYYYDTSGYINNIAGSQLAVDGPVSSNYSAVDAVATYDGGNFYQNDNNIGATEYTGGRISLLWKPIEQLSFTLQHLVQDVEQNGMPYVQLDTGGYTQVALSIQNSFPGIREGLEDDVSITNFVMEYDLGWASVMSSSSWLEQDGQYNNDVTPFFAGIPASRLYSSNADVFIEELRLTSSLEGPLQFIAGAYYEEIEHSGLNPFYALTDARRCRIRFSIWCGESIIACGANFKNDGSIVSIW